MPVFDQCAACGGGRRALGFSSARGGLVCEDCLEGGVPITPEAIAVLREVAEQPLPELRCAAPTAAAEEALRHLHDLYTYHTGTRLRALRFARATGDGRRAGGVPPAGLHPMDDGPGQAHRRRDGYQA